MKSWTPSRRYYRGYGQIVPQANFEEDGQGLPEYAVSRCGAEALNSSSASRPRVPSP